MSKGRALGVAMLVGGLGATVAYGWLLFGVAPLIVLQITAFVAVAAVLAILAWIGYTLATTSPPAPLEPEPQRVAGVQTQTVGASNPGDGEAC